MGYKEKYTEPKPDNIWLKTIANECAETNTLLKALIQINSKGK